MTTPRRRVVWILGSGFSKSLGGPLLKDLLAQRRFELVDATFNDPSSSKPLFPKERRRIYHLFEQFRETATNPGYWSDAEEFLDLVDVAAQEGSPKAPLLNKLISTNTAAVPAAQIRNWALLSVATEVSTYTAAADLQSEVWGPYLDWKRHLVKSGDTIITFNYDTVLECLGSNPNKDLFGEHTVVKPYIDDEQSKSLVGSVPILKLHGSVTWAQKGFDPQTFRTFDKISAFADPNNTGYAPLIAAPGATKKKLCTDCFHDIWTDARRALIRADVIVFMGFRFPPSDSHARSMIVGAIARNNAPYLRVHTVLGPHLHEGDTVRLTNLLHHALRRSGKAESQDAPQVVVNVQSAQKNPLYALYPQPLYAEDFMSVADDKELFGPQPELIYRDASVPLVEIADDGTITQEARAVLR